MFKLTQRQQRNNIKNQLDAKVKFINNSNQLNMFRGALDCVYSLWYNAPMMLPAGKLDEVEFHFFQVTSRQHHRCIIPQAVNTV